MFGINAPTWRDFKRPTSLWSWQEQALKDQYEPVPTIIGRKRKKSGNPHLHYSHPPPLSASSHLCPEELHASNTATQLRSSSFTWLYPHALRMPSLFPLSQNRPELLKKAHYPGAQTSLGSCRSLFPPFRAAAPRFLWAVHFCLPMWYCLTQEGGRLYRMYSKKSFLILQRGMGSRGRVLFCLVSSPLHPVSMFCDVPSWAIWLPACMYPNHSC